MTNEQWVQPTPIICLAVVIMSFMYFYTLYQSEHESLERLKLAVYQTRLENCRND